jgi:ribosomal protein S6--L-glutamate ligase
MENVTKTLDFLSFLNESKKEDKVEILILSAKGDSSTTESFLKESKKKKIVCNWVNVNTIKLEKVFNGHVIITIGEDGKEGKKILIRPENTVIVPRRGVINSTYTKGILRELENSRYFCINTLQSIELCESKYLTSEVLEDNNLPVPKYSLISGEEDLDEALKAVGGKFPVILKLLEGTQGIGVSIVDSYASLKSVYQTIAKVAPGKEILIQEKIDSNYDIRVQVITKNLDGKNTDKDNFIILGAMKRKAVDKDFRTNYSLGGSVSEIKLTKEIQDIACKSAIAVGCHWCGVDIMVDSKSGNPYILEVNASPGTEGISQAIGKPIVDEVIDYIENKKDWEYSNLEIGYLESIEIPGIGKIVAKFDTGNGSASCSIQADDAKEDKGNLIWKVGNKKFKNKIVGYSSTEVGKNIEKRPIIEIDIMLNGSIAKKVKVSPIDRTSKSTPFLANRDLMKNLGVIVNPERTFVISDSPKGYIPAEAKGKSNGGIEFEKKK